MSLSPDSHIGLILNPTAGGGKLRVRQEKLIQLLRNNFTNVNIIKSQTPGGESQCAHTLLESSCEVIIVCGGDGSLHHTINGLLSHRDTSLNLPKITVFPVGSGNDYARHHRISNKPEKFLRTLMDNNTKKVDVGKASFASSQNPCFFINCMGTGLDSKVVKQVGKKKSRRNSAYLKAIFAAFKSFKFPVIHYKIEGRIYKEKLTFIMVSLGKYAGAGMKFAPAADSSNGLFDIITVKKSNKLFILSHLPALYLGKHLKSPLVNARRTNEIQILSTEHGIQLDGEFYNESKCTVTLEKNILNFIIPYTTG